MKKTTAIFDIGKTNKKFFLFDKNYREVFREYSVFDEIEDEDGHPTDDLDAIIKWMKNIFSEILSAKKYEVKAINFSTYGASFVHLGRDGKPLTPLYNYTKKYPKKIAASFYKKYGKENKIAKATASPPSGFLNSGLQLYWLKYACPDIYKNIWQSLHFPQYLSYLFTGIPLSEYTGIGCHTGLWDYKKGDYHDWVYQENIDKILAPVVSTSTSINMDYGGRRIRVGIGIHDSSAALLPYISCDRKPFVLVSTGTWSIALNPFNEQLLTTPELKNDCLNYMRTDGKPVKAARLFLGNEYKLQIKKLCKHFKVKYGRHRSIKFSPDIYKKLKKLKQSCFKFETIPNLGDINSSDFSCFDNFETAFHKLMMELMELQFRSLDLVIGKTKIKRIYIDGGFADNDIFVKLISRKYRGIKLRTTQSPLGSALGAALIVSEKETPAGFLKNNYGLKKHEPLIIR
ncbi:MAG TPA: carbohydrate kinase [Bacteroidetes bacterium]|nr:carbohydrate kinase [Bacteroidota bacterium]